MSSPYEGEDEGGVMDLCMTRIFNQKQQTSLRKKLRNEMTKSETVLWKYLQKSQLGYKFRRQCGIGSNIVDFYCPALRFAIEIDGITHEGEVTIRNDDVRQRHLESLGLVVKRYSSSDVFNSLNDVLEDIRSTCEDLNHPVPMQHRNAPPS